MTSYWTQEAVLVDRHRLHLHELSQSSSEGRSDHQSRGEQLAKQHAYAEAMQYFEAALALIEAQARVQLSKSVVGDEAQDAGKLEEEWAALIDDDLKRKLSRVLYWMGECYYGMTELESALEYYDAAAEAIAHVTPSELPAVRKEEDDARHQIFFDRGYCQSKLRNHDQAVQDFTKAIELNADFSWSYFHRGWNYYYCHKFDDAVRDFHKAIELESKSGDKSGDREETEEESSLKDMQDWLIEAWGTKAKQLVKEKRYGEALVAVNSALELQMENNWNYKHISMKATCLLELKRYEESIEVYTIAHDMDPRDTACLVNRGYSLYKLQYFDAAMEDYQAALEINPKYETAMKGLEKAALAKQKYLLENIIDVSAEEHVVEADDKKPIVKPVQIAG